MRRAVLVLAATLTVAVPPAFAGDELSKAARSLQRDPVYVAADAVPSLSASEATNLRNVIRGRAGRVFIAVLPERALTEADGVDRLPQALHDATRLDGAYGVIAGRNFRAASSLNIGLAPGEAGQLATASFEANHPSKSGGVYPMLADWVGRVQAALGGRPAAPNSRPQEAPPVDLRDAPPHDFIDPNQFVGRPFANERGGSGFPVGVIVLFLVLGLGGAGLAAMSGLGRLGGSTDSGLWRSNLWSGRRRGTDADSDGGFFSSRSSPSDRGSGFDSPSSSGGGSWGGGGDSGSGGSGGSGGSSGFDSSGNSGGGSW